MDQLIKQHNRTQVSQDAKAFLNSPLGKTIMGYLRKKANVYDTTCKRIPPTTREHLVTLAGAQEALRFYGDIITQIETLADKGELKF